MAYDVSALTAYVDELSQSNEIWHKAVVSGASSASFNIINSKFNTVKLPTMVGDRDIFQDGTTCAVSPSGNDDFTQESITLNNVVVLKEYCMKALEATYTGTYLPQGQTYNDALRASYEETLRQVEAQNEINAWKGDTGGAGSLAMGDGFVKLIGTTNIAKCLTGAVISTGAITAANALGFVEGLVAAVMNDIDTAAAALAGELELWISPEDRRFYDLNYRTTYGDTTHASNFDEDFVQGTNIRFKVAPGLSNEAFMCISPKMNLTKAVDLLSDETRITGGTDEYDQNVWLKTEFKVGYGCRNYSQIAVHA